MPTYVAQLKCLTKLCVSLTSCIGNHERALTFSLTCRARATDRICRPEFWKLSTCMQTHGKGAPACKDAWMAFDMCTEDF